ncbi:MAG: hypothetical protein GKS03_10705 [Alphaproteobacteria bacterium]|nr:hypothetical protein [Alphaproteobacteria bacterium]
MNEIVRHDVAANLEISISGHKNVIHKETEAKVDAIWDAALRVSDLTLFNGTLYSVTDISPQRITVQPTEYKRFFAQTHDRVLVDALGIRPLACTGVVRCADGLIFAKRSEAVTLNQGFWELAPSGVFDDTAKNPRGTLDTRTVFASELFEELGIPASTISTHEVLVALEDKEQNSIDLILSASVSIDASGVIKCFATRETDEYSEVSVIQDKDIRDFIAKNAADIVPISLDILDFLKLS